MDAKYLNSVVSETNKYYGGLKPSTTNVLYVHGSIDPWHALGLTNSKDSKKPTIYIEGKFIIFYYVNIRIQLYVLFVKIALINYSYMYVK